MVPQILIITQQSGLLTATHNHHIKIAISVEICGGGPSPHHGTAKILPAMRLINTDELVGVFGTGIPEQVGHLLIPLTFTDFFNFIFKMPIRCQKIQTSIKIVIQPQNSERQFLLCLGPQTG